MLGIIYLILCMLTGLEMAGCLFPRQTTERGNRIWVVLPAAFGIGILMLTWAVYILSWMFSICAGVEHPLFYGNLIVFLVDILLLSGIFRWKKKKQKKMFVISERMISRKWILKKELLLFGILTVFVTWMMFYVFYMKDGILYSGFSVYGDYAPHTAMMRSFSRGNNFPTQYPHYGGQDVKYHFMFQFLVGNLEYLGFRLDLGYNLVSILSLVGFLMVLYGISYRMFKSFWAGAAAIVFFFFRSGTAFWRYLWEHLQAGDQCKRNYCTHICNRFRTCRNRRCAFMLSLSKSYTLHWCNAWYQSLCRCRIRWYRFNPWCIYRRYPLRYY